MVCVNQNRFPHYQWWGAAGGGEGRKQAQQGAEMIFKYIFSLSIETHSSL